jgi:hypothetical protein
MNRHQPRPWPALDLAELRYGIAFGSSVAEIAEFLQRDVEDVRAEARFSNPICCKRGRVSAATRRRRRPGRDRALRRSPPSECARRAGSD